jgi:hypothetical protein
MVEPTEMKPVKLIGAGRRDLRSANKPDYWDIQSIASLRLNGVILKPLPRPILSLQQDCATEMRGS